MTKCIEAGTNRCFLWKTILFKTVKSGLPYARASYYLTLSLNTGLKRSRRTELSMKSVVRTEMEVIGGEEDEESKESKRN